MSDGSLKKIIADCFDVRPQIYWADLLGTALVAWTAFVATELLPPALAAIAFVVSVFAFYRGILFIHELTHRDRDELRGFSIAWTLLFGMPCLLPSFMFRGVHLEHHNKKTYGTRHDFEYLPFGALPIWATLKFASQALFIPAAMALRFGVLTPLSVFIPPLRRTVVAYASALTVRFTLAREPAKGRDLRNWRVQEAMCFGWVVVAVGALPLQTLAHAYALMTAMFLVNALRTPIAHRYFNLSERELTFTEQVLDSVNIDRGLVVAELLCPLGFRYHALHHLFPAIPYHRLGVAHRRLRAQLPRDAYYHSTVEPTVGTALASLWRNTWRLTSRSSSAPARRAR